MCRFRKGVGSVKGGEFSVFELLCLFSGYVQNGVVGYMTYAALVKPSGFVHTVFESYSWNARMDTKRWLNTFRKWRVRSISGQCSLSIDKYESIFMIFDDVVRWSVQSTPISYERFEGYGLWLQTQCIIWCNCNFGSALRAFCWQGALFEKRNMLLPRALASGRVWCVLSDMKDLQSLPRMVKKLDFLPPRSPLAIRRPLTGPWA